MSKNLLGKGKTKVLLSKKTVLIEDICICDERSNRVFK